MKKNIMKNRLKLIAVKGFLAGKSPSETLIELQSAVAMLKRDAAHRARILTALASHQTSSG